MSKSQSLAREAHGAIIAMMLDGTLKPGDPLRETVLAQQLNMSRTPVREAIKRIEAEGLATVDGRLPHVRRLPASEVEEIFFLRRELEPALARSAMQLPASELDAMEHRIRDLMKPDADRNDLQWQIDNDFHDMLVSRSGNETARAVLASLRQRTCGFDHKQVPQRFIKGCQEHLNMLDAIRASDLAKLHSELDAHLQNARDAVLKRLEQWPDTDQQQYEQTMKCLIIQPIHEAGLRRLRDAGIVPILCPNADIETVIEMIPGCAAAITRDAGLQARAIAAADALRILVVHGTGHDPVDKQAATKAGIVVANTPGTNARSVAELALGLAVAVARRIPAADHALRQGLARFRESAAFTELSGRTALIVGWGATGRVLGAMLHQGLGMTVTAYSPRPPSESWASHATDLHGALASADLVSLHAPLLPQTQNLIDAAAFAAMKQDAILVNVARAGLVDEPALLDALTNRKLGGAGLDVHSAQAPHGPLAAFGNLVFTPHVGGSTEAALARTAEAAAAHVITALSGHIPDTAINPEALRATA